MTAIARTPRPKNEQVPGSAQLEGPDAADEHVADEDVEEPPEPVHRRGWESLAGRRGERALEGMARDPVDEVRDSVREEV